MRFPHGNETECDVCSEHANATWTGHNAINICGMCAPEALGGLLADAISLVGPRRREIAKQRIRELELGYWRALALRLIDEAQP